ncbi:MAG: TonB-dependent receptor domain-containing protein [Sandaracinaceae bacterium]
MKRGVYGSSLVGSLGAALLVLLAHPAVAAAQPDAPDDGGGAAAEEGEPAEGEPAEGEPAGGEPAEGEPAEGEPAPSQAADERDDGDDAAAPGAADGAAEADRSDDDSDDPDSDDPDGGADSDEADSDEAVGPAPVIELPDEAQTCSRGQGIRGVVRDSATDTTLPDAEVRILRDGRTVRRTRSDLDAYFAINLPRGTYRVRASYEGYDSFTSGQVTVGRRECPAIALELVQELEALTITVARDPESAASRLRERRESTSVQDGISAEEISQTQDSDAGAAARRVVGATVVGRYLFVRGLGGRYTSVLLNRAYLPPSDPDNPGVQLDLFPAGVLSSLDILKTFTPRLPGDAAGGTMLIATRSFPEQLELAFSLKAGFNTETTFQSVPQGIGSGTEILGFDNGFRSLPSDVPRDQQLVRGVNGLTQDEALMISESFTPSLSFGGPNSLVAPNFGFGFALGNTVEINDRRLGYYLTLSYNNDYQVLRGEQVNSTNVQQVDDPDNPGETLTEVNIRAQRERTSFLNDVQWGALGTLAYEVTDHDELSLTVFATQAGTNYVGTFDTFDADRSQFVLQTRQRYVARNLLFGQLRGIHRDLPMNMEFQWRLNGAIGSRDQPDTRDVFYISSDGMDFFWRSDPGRTQRLFLNFDQREVSSSVDLTIPIRTAGLTLGGLVRSGERNFALRRFDGRTAGNMGIPQELASLPPEELFAAPNFNPDGVIYVETTNSDDAYAGFIGLAAGYGMLDWELTPNLRLIGGARLEVFRQTVQSFRITDGGPNPDFFNGTRRTDIDPLGSLAFQVKLTDDMNVRASWGSTVARPNLRELAPFLYPDFIRQRNIQGNPDLRRTRIENFDLRWEFFPSTEEVIAVSAFGKYFDNPISLAAITEATFRFINADEAVNFGGEFEARFNFANFAEELDWLDAGANLTLVFSRVFLDPAEIGQATNPERPLAGQSPFVMNANVGIRPPDTNVEVRLYYNVFGPRIIDVGVNGLPDFYQQP